MDMEKAQISVIVAIYNVKFYLDKCINSIMSQTYQNLDIILVDDGSTDGSGFLCDKFAEQDHRVKVIHQKNGGLVRARKAGLQEAHGDYVAFVDGDDWVESEMYASLLNNMISTNADFVHSDWYSEIDEKTRARRYCYSNLLYDESYNKAMLLEQCLRSAELIDNTIWSKMYKKEFIKKCYVNVPDGQDQGEDLLCFCECILNSQRISTQHDAYYHRVYRENSLSQTKDVLSLAKYCKCFYYLGKIFSKYACNKSMIDLRDQLLVQTILPRVCEFSGFYSEIPIYYFDSMELIKNRKVVLFGAGKVGRDFYAQICKYPSCKIVAWVDTDYKKYNYEYSEVVGDEQLRRIDFDILIIAVKNQSVVQEIKEKIISEGILEEKIIWKEPKSRLDIQKIDDFDNRKYCRYVENM